MRALITGINGMDGSHLADLLLDKGYIVYGMERRSSSKSNINTGHLKDKITILNGDMTDQNSLLRCIKESNPDEFRRGGPRGDLVQIRRNSIIRAHSFLNSDNWY